MSREQSYSTPSTPMMEEACYFEKLVSTYVMSQDRLCGLVVRVPGYTMEMYCISCEVRTEFIYVM
jgi:hypothetical protein